MGLGRFDDSPAAGPRRGAATGEDPVWISRALAPGSGPGDMSTTPAPPESESLPRSIQRYTAVLKRQWWVILLTTVIAIVAAVVYVQRATPVYSASSKVVVGQGE